MNYRHLFHVGNFADVIKHLALVLVLDHLRTKEKPFVVLDAFAGIGLYDLTHPWVLRNPEYKNGIAKVFAAQQNWNDDIRMYASHIQALNKSAEPQVYPGSPLIAAKMLRPQDELIVNELHPDDFDTLAEIMRPFDNVRGECDDAYVFLRAHLPPDIKRGVVLVDPPFEQKDEFEKLARQMVQWKKRWATGIYMVWYPIKAGAPIDLLSDAAQKLDMPDTVDIRFNVKDENEGGLTGTGLLVLNAPYQFEQRMRAAIEILRPILSGD